MYHAIVFFPLIGALIAGLFGRVLGAKVCEYVTTGCLAFSCLIAWGVFLDGSDHMVRVQVAHWFSAGDLTVDWAFRVDTLTRVMLVVVTTVSTLVHLYSVGYMEEDAHRPRFFAYLSLFTFAMLMLVTADNLVQMFFGWEGVGLASYLLIGFWYEKPSANAAAMKAFIVNRVGDFGFSLGIFLVFVLFGSVAFDGIFPRAEELKDAHFHFLGHDWHALTLTCLLLFMGAMGKSAQFLLHTWLPDAMEGPTPVSALIHAATMVTAGVFMVARLSPLFELAPDALVFVTVIGGITAFFAATVGLVQNDIKRVIAYSTCSQLGYMFVALGVGAYSAGIFHLFTHAFFKALLFLGAGSVIHAMHHEQDMRNMGALRRFIPFTTAMMTIGTLALIGFPFTAGYYSKDAIIEAAYASTRPGHTLAFLATVIAALMTSFYSWRLFFLTFEGPARWGAHGHDDHHAVAAHQADGAPGHHEGVAHDGKGHDVEPASHSAIERHDHVHAPHESPWTMTVPLGILAFGALFAGLIFKDRFIGEGMEAFWGHALAHGHDNHIMHDIHTVPALVSAAPFIMLVIGFVLAFWMYIRRPELPGQLAAQQPLLYRFLLNKWYFDELYDRIFVRPAKDFGLFLWKEADGRVIDGIGPDGISARVVDVTRGVVRLQTGYVYHYAFVMLIGVAGFVTWYMMTGTAGGALMLGLGILSGLLIVPLCGAAFILTLSGDEKAVARNARWAALATTIVTFLLSLIAWGRFDATSPSFQLVESHAWLTDTIRFKLGLDGFSMPLVLLTTFLMPFCIGASWHSIESRVKEYFVAFLVLETTMIGVFCSLDLVLFYLFFEAGLIPMFLIIGIWGGKRRIYASFKFFLYTLLGSVLMLLAIMAMYWHAGTTDIPTLLQHRFPAGMQWWLWLAFFASFAVKMPMWPVHTWLPDAHVEAPTAGSVILAGILLKMGGYGFIRVSLPMLPDASQHFAPLVFALSVIAIIFTSLTALMQTDIKKLIAYSSVAHMGFVTLGLFTLTEQGIQGALFLMISHGIVSGALFLGVGVVYDRMHTREISAYGGLVKRMPLYAVAMMVFTMANVGLPGTSGFVGEFLAMMGAFRANPTVAFFSVFGIILSAGYALWLYARVIYGRLEKPNLQGILDLDNREKLILAPLVALTIYYGVHPAPILDVFAPSTEALMASMKAALANTQTAAAALPLAR